MADPAVRSRTTPALRDRWPLVVGHRGASGHLPEHTLPAYELAVRLGADRVEADLVITADGVLVARHDAELGGSTDIADHPELADRRCARTVDGDPWYGWFVDDLTRDELRGLRAVERIPQLRPAGAEHDRQHPVPTLDDLLALRARLSDELDREIGLCLELKHAHHFAARGLPLEPPLVAALTAAGLDRPDAPVHVMSFETGDLRALRDQLAVPLVQLLDTRGAPPDLLATGDPRTYADLLTDAGLAGIADYADAVGPAKDLVVARGPDGSLAGPTGLADRAHAAGLDVLCWTFRDENAFLPTDLAGPGGPADHGDGAAECAAFLAAGVDALITDHPGTAVAARDAFRVDR